MEELHEDPTVGPRTKVWTRSQKWKWCRRWCAGEAQMRDSQGGGELDPEKGVSARAAPTSCRLNVMVRYPPLYPRGGPKWGDHYPEESDRPLTILWYIVAPLTILWKVYRVGTVKWFPQINYLYISDFRMLPYETTHYIAQLLQVSLMCEVIVVAVASVDVLLDLCQVQADWIDRFRLQRNVSD